MKERQLGTLTVSSLGLGCMGFSHAYGAAMNEDEAISCIRQAYDQGYRFFDTAACYQGITEEGKVSYNEVLVGQALHDVRDKVVIATKFGVTLDGHTIFTDSSPIAIRHAVEDSLKKLGIDRIDLYYQHRIDPKVEPEVVAEEMAKLIEEGLISHWGISETTEEYLRRAHRICPVTAVQNRYSMMARWHESLFPVLEELNVGFVAFSPLANGFLTGQATVAGTFAKGDYRNQMPQYEAQNIQAAQDLFTMMATLSQQKGVTDSQLALAWMLAKKPWIVPIPGSRRLERIIENAKATEVILSDDEVVAIDTALSAVDIPVFGGHTVASR